MNTISDRQWRRPPVPASPWPRRPCPRHDADLDGGPVVFRCPYGHGVQAADLDMEVTR